MLWKIVRGIVVSAVVAAAVGFILNQTVGPGW